MSLCLAQSTYWENWSTLRKTSRSKDEKNQQQTQPTFDAASEIEPDTHWWEASAFTLRHPCSPRNPFQAVLTTVTKT